MSKQVVMLMYLDGRKRELGYLRDTPRKLRFDNRCFEYFSADSMGPVYKEIPVRMIKARLWDRDQKVMIATVEVPETAGVIIRRDTRLDPPERYFRYRGSQRVMPQREGSVYVQDFDEVDGHHIAELPDDSKSSLAQPTRDELDELDRADLCVMADRLNIVTHGVPHFVIRERIRQRTGNPFAAYAHHRSSNDMCPANNPVGHRRECECHGLGAAVAAEVQARVAANEHEITMAAGHEVCGADNSIPYEYTTLGDKCQKNKPCPDHDEHGNRRKPWNS
jgi:hypothetical protein